MAHLRKKGDKKWQIVLNVGIDPRTGRKKRKTKVVNCSETKAKKIMHKLAAKHENDVYSGEIDITLGEYLKRWLNEIAKNEVAQNTFRDYNGVIKNHIIPALGNLKINQLKPHHMIKYQNEKLNNGRLRGKGGLSKRTVENHHRILSKALSDAVVIYQFLENNPIRDVKA
ncbi:MAG: N-terminal phage integrase SAM-like domain-containing protein, partial [Candidatus Woesearchaeota archaeon]